MHRKRPLSDKELYEALMNDSDDECEREIPLEDGFSDISETEDVLEEPEGNISFTELENESVVMSEPESNKSESHTDEERDVVVADRTWKYIAPKKGKKKVSEFIRQDKGLTDKSKNVLSVIDCFRIFISSDIIEMIIKYSNQRAKTFINLYNDKHENKLPEWVDIDRTELDAFFGILILTGRFREARESVHNIWSIKNQSLSRPVYRAIMSRNRFIDILRFIRFDDLNTRVQRKEQDKLAPLRDIADIFAKNCRESYCPSACGTIDEQLVSFRGRCPFRVYIPSKPGKYGIKIWALCDAENFFCCNFQVYLGKVGDVAERNQGPRVVKTLSSHWYGTGRNVTTDNFSRILRLPKNYWQKI